LKGEHWLISRALSGEQIRLVRMEPRVLVYYCRTLVRELDLGRRIFPPRTVKDLPGHFVNHVVGLDKKREKWGTPFLYSANT
ncbi:MAG: hypothetical protein ACLPVW_12320, partial [Terriglobales bacterium]